MQEFHSARQNNACAESATKQKAEVMGEYKESREHHCNAD